LTEYIKLDKIYIFKIYIFHTTQFGNRKFTFHNNPILSIHIHTARWNCNNPLGFLETFIITVIVTRKVHPSLRPQLSC